MNESFQNECTCWAESRKPVCGVANSMEESSVRAVIESCSILALPRQNFWTRLCRNIEKVMGIETVRGHIV